MSHRICSIISVVSRALQVVAVGGFVALLGCNSGAPETKNTAPARKTTAQISNEFTATAQVTAVEREHRRVTLKREDGTMLALQVGPAARNFDQIAIGDKVRVRYKESLAASLRPAGDKATDAQGVVEAARTEPGAKPGGGVGVAMSVRVKIESIDVEHNLVVFSLASGELIAHRLATPEGREFVRSLVVGNIVQLDYAEALALTVDEL